MDKLHEMMAEVAETGFDQFNARTGKVCRAKVGHQVEFDLSEGCPAVSSKKLFVNSAIGELCGFFRGYTNAADFRKLGCKIWDDNANLTPAWLANPYRGGIVDNLGPIYGAQWTAWRAFREQDLRDQVMVNHLLKEGFSLVAQNGDLGIFKKLINQLENALKTIITDPSNRRIIISGWNVGELDMMALVPCHMDYRFTVFEGQNGEAGTLHVTMTIRSWDLFLGAAFNIFNTALFLSIMARLSGLKPGKVVIQATNAHIYADHFDQVNEQLSRTGFPLPTLKLSEKIQPIRNLDDIPGVFAKIEPEDIWLEGYQSHAAIKAPMAV